MKQNKLIAVGCIVLLLQTILSDFLSLDGVRPDFILIFIIYVSIRLGPFEGILYGFSLGLIADLLGVSSFFGLSPLTYSITAYILGTIYQYRHFSSQIQFHATWLSIIFFHFLCNTFIRYQETVFEYPFHYISLWLLTTFYTLGFVLILQILNPLYQNN